MGLHVSRGGGGGRLSPRGAGFDGGRPSWARAPLPAVPPPGIDSGSPLLLGATGSEDTRGHTSGALAFQVLCSLLNQSENLSGWPRVVSEDIVRQVHKLKNEMFVMGGKIRGTTLLPVPEHLGSLDSTLKSAER